MIRSDHCLFYALVCRTLLNQFSDKNDDAPDGHHDQKHAHEAGQSGDDVGKFHVTGVGYLLTYLNAEGNDNQQSKYVDPGNGHDHLSLCQVSEHWIDDGDHSHAENADDEEMQHLVRHSSEGHVAVSDDGIVDLGHQLYQKL